MAITSFFTPLLLLVQAILFLAPGLAVGLWLHRKKQLNPLYILLVAGVVGGLIGYGIFWLYILQPLVGEWVSVLLLGVSWAAAIVVVSKKTTRQILKKSDILLPLALMLSVAIFYNSAFLSCEPVATTASCYTKGLPRDNTLQQIFADNVAAGKPTQLLGDWKGSDRPPLVSGVILAQEPLVHTTYVGFDGYQLLASLLQCLWVPAVWALGRLLKLSPKRLALMLGLLIVSGFFFFNSIFVWPKLIAASYGLLAFCLLFFEKPRKLYWGIAGAAAAAAFLSHAGVAFTLLPMGILVLLPRFWPGWRTILLAVGTAAIIVAPWMLYQNFYDPPGNRLAKWHLAGVVEVDNRPFLQSLTDTYTKTPFTTIVANKSVNVRQLFEHSTPASLYGTGKLATLRDATSRFVFASFTILNIGWIVLCFRAARKQLQKNVDTGKLKLVLGMGLVSLVAWALILFGPGTNIYTGSYLTFVLLFVGLATIVSQLPRRWALAIGGVQLSYFVVVWLVSVLSHEQLDYIYILWMLASFGAGCWILQYIAAIPAEQIPHARNN